MGRDVRGFERGAGAAGRRPLLGNRASVLSVWVGAMLLLAACGPAAAPSAAPAAGDAAAAASAESACDPVNASVFAGWSGEFSGVAALFAAKIQRHLLVTEDDVTLTPLESVADINETVNGHMVAFLTAHGSPAGIEVSKDVTLPFESLLLGQCDGGSQSQLRYLFFSSCKVLAHGPNPCSDATGDPDYACPGEWKYRADSTTAEAIDEDDMRSLYVRWGERIGNGLRMLCGSSTDLPPFIVNNMWDEVGTKMALADAVIYGLSSGTVGICMARGGPDFAASPLMTDTTFTTTANSFDDESSAYYHLQYSKPIGFARQNVHSILVGQTQWDAVIDDLTNVSESFPGCLPVGGAADAEELARLQEKLAESPAGQLINSYEEQDTTLPDEARSEAEALEQGETEEALVQTAVDWAQQAVNQNSADIGLEEREVRTERAHGIYLLISTLPTDRDQWDTEGLRVAYKSAIVEFPQLMPLSRFQAAGTPGAETQVEQLDQFYGVLNEVYEQPEQADLRNGDDPPLLHVLGGSTLVQLNADGTPILVHDKRQLVGPAPGGNQRTRTPLEAFQRSLALLYRQELAAALDIDERGMRSAEFLDTLLAGWAGSEDQIPVLLRDNLGEPDSLPYRLHSWNFGYAPEELNGDLHIVYTFLFVANAGYGSEEHPPKVIVVWGQLDEACAVE